MDEESLKSLIDKYLNGKATSAEKMLIDEWYNRLIKLQLQDPIDADFSKVKAMIWNPLSESINQQKSFKKTYAYASSIAAIVALIIFGLYFFTGSESEPKEAMVKTSREYDIKPGKVGATLTLANGAKIVLTEAAQGTLSKESGVIVLKSADGQLNYKIDGDFQEAGTTNTLMTGRGETYKIYLKDGSMVWLNAESSLTYDPALLKDGKRVVKLVGEGYFEISEDKRYPFVVQTKGQEVEVLGTHFNISSYDNDAVQKTTLLKGSIKLTSSETSRILRPGQQGKIINGEISVVEIDVDIPVAWKNSEFAFEQESIETVMKMVERWYNVETIFVGDKTSELLTGSISRFDNLSKLLKIIEATGAAHFEINGRKVYVSK